MVTGSSPRPDINRRPYLSVKVYQARVLRWSDTETVLPCQQCREGYIAMVHVTISLTSQKPFL